MNYLSQLITFLILYNFSNCNYQKALILSIIIDLSNVNRQQCHNTNLHLNKSLSKDDSSYNHRNINSYDYNSQTSNLFKNTNTFFDINTDNTKLLKNSNDLENNNYNCFNIPNSNYYFRNFTYTSPTVDNSLKTSTNDNLSTKHYDLNHSADILTPINHNSSNSNYPLSTANDNLINSSCIQNYNNSIEKTKHKNKHIKEKTTSHTKIKFTIISSIKQINKSDILKVSKAKKVEYKNNLPLYFHKKQLNIDKIPFLIGICTVHDVFIGSLNFSYPINDVIIDSNQIIIKENYFLVDNFMGISSALLYFEGYLKTIFYSLEPITPSNSITRSRYKENIIYTPFTISKYLNIGYLPKNQQYLLKDSKLHITNFTYEVMKELTKNTEFDNDSNSYNNCNLIISLDYSINIYSK